MDLIRNLFSRRWWWVTLLVVVLMVILARLGFWQLDRLEQRRAANAVVAAALDSPPVDVGELVQTDDLDSIENRLVTAVGEYDFENQLILKVQNWQGSAGVHLITPLLIQGGASAVLVDRGWIPDAQNTPEGVAAYDDPGPVVVDGYVALSDELSRTAAVPESPQREWYRVDISAIQKQLPYEIYPFYVIQSKVSNEQLPYKTDRQVELSEGSHLSYAVQWFIFSIGLGIAYVVFVNRQSEQQAHEP